MKNNFRNFLFLFAIGVMLLLAGGAVLRGSAAFSADFSVFLPLLNKPERINFEGVGPDGGLVVSLAVNPQDDLIVYAGTWGAGVYKTTDGGTTWQEANNGLGNEYIQSLAIDPQVPSTIYAGTYGYGVYKSTDSGATWHPTGPGLTARPVVYALVIDPTRPSILYAGTRDLNFSGPLWGGGAYRSENGGESWMAINNDLDEDWVYGLAVNPGNPDMIYAALHTKGINYSWDRGNTWYPLNSGISDPSTRDIVINPFTPAEMYVGSWHGASIFKTLDGGLLWKFWNDGMYGAQVFDLEHDPSDPNVVYVGTYYKGIKKTINGGDKWLEAGLPDSFIYRIKVSPQHPQTVFAGTRGGGLYKSVDGATTWIQQNAGIKNAWVTSVVANTPNEAIVSVMGASIYKTVDAGATWAWSGFGMRDHYTNFVERSPLNPLILYAGSENSGFYISLDGGNNWEQRISGLDDQLVQYNSPGNDQPFIEDFLRSSSGQQLDSELVVDAISLGIHPTQPETLYLGTTLGLYFSDNNGIAWHKNSELGGRGINDICIDPNNPLKILVGTGGGASGSLLITVDGNTDWNPANTGLGGASVHTVIADPYTPDKFYVGSDIGIYVSVDGGFTWNRIGLAGQIVKSIAVASPTEIYAGTLTGLYRQKSGGEWINMHDGMRHDHVEILDLAFVPGSTAFYVATQTQGVYYHAPSQP